MLPQKTKLIQRFYLRTVYSMVQYINMYFFIFQLAPSNFTYITSNISGEGVTIPVDPLIGCECTSCSVSNGKLCSCSNSSRLNYEKGLLKVRPGKPIYECNSRCCNNFTNIVRGKLKLRFLKFRCKCGPTCSNRVVQKGSLITSCVFKTANKGWGVKTLQAIPRGTFVMEYVGEVIKYPTHSLYK